MVESKEQIKDNFRLKTKLFLLIIFLLNDEPAVSKLINFKLFLCHTLGDILRIKNNTPIVIQYMNIWIYYKTMNKNKDKKMKLHVA